MKRLPLLASLFFVFSSAACESDLNQSPEDLSGQADTTSGATASPTPDAATTGSTSSDAATPDAAEDVAPSCDLASLDLRDFEAWNREAGWWVGEYTLLGADGNPSVSQSWPYR